MTAQPLACQSVAARVATSDRAETADRILQNAITDALAAIRQGRRDDARRVLARAQESAGRITGPRQQERSAP